MLDSSELTSVVVAGLDHDAIEQPPKPKLRSVSLAAWFGGGPKAIQFLDNSDVGNYPTKRPMG